MREKYTKVRLWVIGPSLVYLLVFLLWFPNWQDAPQSALTRALGVVFGIMTAVLAVAAVIGGFFVPTSFSGILQRAKVYGDPATITILAKIATQVYKTFIAREFNEPVIHVADKRSSLSPATPPPLEIIKSLKDGTPVRGACPLCQVEFSTEAFDGDMSYPHAGTLKKWYEEHFAAHFEES